MTGYVGDIEKETIGNSNFRKVIFTAKHSQLVVMSLLPKEDIGVEVHQVDQFLRIESGEGKVILNGEETAIKDGFAIVVPAGTEHNIINTSSDKKMKLYTVYSPPEHRPDTIHQTKADAIRDEADEYRG